MRWVVLLALFVTITGCSTIWHTGSVYRKPCTHVGVRVSTDDPKDWGATIQVSTDAPFCREFYEVPGALPAKKEETLCGQSSALPSFRCMPKP